MLVVLTAGALAGLFSAPHCALMCGPVGMHAASNPRGLTRYQVGRLASYGIAGALAGLFGNALLVIVWGSPIASALSWALALSLLLAAYRVWPRRPGPGRDIVRLRPPGKPPLIARALRALPMRPEILGAASVLLPCAALWSGLAIAAASASALLGAVAMLAFASISGLGVMSSGLLARGLSRLGIGAKAVSALLVVGAMLFVLRPIAFDRPAETATEPQLSCPLHQKAAP